MKAAPMSVLALIPCRHVVREIRPRIVVGVPVPALLVVLFLREVGPAAAVLGSTARTRRALEFHTMTRPVVAAGCPCWCWSMLGLPSCLKAIRKIETGRRRLERENAEMESVVRSDKRSNRGARKPTRSFCEGAVKAPR